MKTAAANDWVPFVALQTDYNLVEWEAYETYLRFVVARHGLASGYLTGKYSGGSTPGGPRSAVRYRERDGERVIDALKVIADRRAAAIGAAALAWPAHQPFATKLRREGMREEDILKLVDWLALELGRSRADRVLDALGLRRGILGLLP